MADVVSYLDAAGHLAPTSTMPVPAHVLTDLYRKLQSQPVIEEAKGILMGHYGLNAETAFGILRRWSSDGNIKVRTLAQALVDAVAQQPCSEIPPHHLIQRIVTRQSQGHPQRPANT